MEDEHREAHRVKHGSMQRGKCSLQIIFTKYASWHERVCSCEWTGRPTWFIIYKTVLWDMTPCILVQWYCCFHLLLYLADGQDRFLRKVSTSLSNFTASCPKKTVFLTFTAVKTLNSICVCLPWWRWSWESSVGIATGYGLNDRVPVGSRIFSFPCRPDRLWGSSNLLSNGYRGLFPRG
jgi:hypothetical protein